MFGPTKTHVSCVGAEGTVTLTVHTLLCRADHCVVVLVGFVVVGFHLHSIFSPKHLRVLTVSQEVLVVLLQVPQCQPVLLHPQGLKL